MSTPPGSKRLLQACAPTGIEGLDDVLGGGLTANQLYLVEGVPGSGKTTLALQFLMEGARRGEPVLYVTLSETAQELHAIAASHGWSLDGIAIHEVLPRDDTPRARRSVHDVPSVRGGAGRDDRARSSRRSSGCSPRASCSTRSRRSACWPAPRCATAGRCSRSSSTSRGRGCTVLLLDDRTSQGPRPPGAEHRARRDPARPDPPRVRRGAPAPAGAQVPRRAVPRRLSRLQDPRAAGSRCSRASSPPSIARAARREGSPAGSPSSTSCSAAASSAARARCSSARRAPASRRSPRSSSRPPPSAGRSARCSSSTRASPRCSTRCDGLGIALAAARRVGARATCIRSIPPSSRRASSRTRSAAPSSGDGAAIVVIDSLNGYLNAMPGRALPDHPAARDPHLSRPEGRRHAAGRARTRA